jgi:hypothetical protein
VSENCKELYDLLILYCSYKIPEVKLLKQLSRIENIKKDFYEINYMLPLITNKYKIKDFMTV